MSAPIYVVDASVGVKWFRNESGSDDARDLLANHAEGVVALVVDALFFYEVLRVASRDGRPEDVERVWLDLKRLDLITVPLGEELVSAAASVRARYGCSLYDAFSAGLSEILGATLVSADARAHASLPNARILGG